MQNNEQHRTIGAIIGAAVGDALGMPTECISERELAQHYNGRVTKYENPLSTHPNSHLKAGQYTDDTQQMLILIDSLYKNKGLNLQDFGKHLGDWALLNEKERINGKKTHWRFPGATSLEAGLKLSKGEAPETTGSPWTTSCGSIMRVAPIGAFYRTNIDDVVKYARLSSTPTHNSDICKDAAAFVAATIAYLINGNQAIEAVEKATRHITDKELIARIKHAIEIKNLEPNKATNTLGLTSSALDTIGIAVYSFLHTPEDFKETVLNCVNAVPGDTDSYATIAGAFSGAHLGQHAIPLEWRTKIENDTHIKRMAEDMYWTRPHLDA